MKINKPWGFFEQLTSNKTTTIKILTILAGNRTSLQFHKYRSEMWYVLDGYGYAVLEEKKKIKVGDEIHIPKKAIHRLEAITDMKILEICFGLFQESDITRIEDDYSRVQ